MRQCFSKALILKCEGSPKPVDCTRVGASTAASARREGAPFSAPVVGGPSDLSSSVGAGDLATTSLLFTFLLLTSYVQVRSQRSLVAAYCASALCVLQLDCGLQLDCLLGLATVVTAMNCCSNCMRIGDAASRCSLADTAPPTPATHSHRHWLRRPRRHNLQRRLPPRCHARAQLSCSLTPTILQQPSAPSASSPSCRSRNVAKM